MEGLRFGYGGLKVMLDAAMPTALALASWLLLFAPSPVEKRWELQSEKMFCRLGAAIR